MSINIGDNFSYLGKKFLDDREHFDTVAKMKECNDVPNGFITYCDETNTRYEYHTDNEEDATLGKWRVFKSVPDVNFDEYVTQDELEEAIGSVDVTEQLGDYATKTYVADEIAKAQLENEEIDLSGYAKTEDIPTKTSELTNDSGYLTNIPSEYITETELNAKGYLTEHQSLEDYAKKSELHNHSNKSVLDSITSDKVAEWDNKSTFDGDYNSLTNKPTIPTVTNDLTNELKSNYDAAYDHSQSAHAPSDAQKNSDITKAEIEAKLTGNINSHTHDQYLTEHQDISHLANKSDVPTKVSQLENDEGYLTEHQSLEGLASETYVDNKVSNLVNSAPETLDTLNELAQALGDDPNFATTVSTQIGKKVDKVEGKSLVDDDEIERLSNVDNYDDTEVRGLITDLQNNKVDKEEGKSLISTSEISRLSNVDNYDDTELRNLINAKANPSDIPTKVSELENDKGYLTEHQDISHLANKDEIPTKVSELENDRGYLTEHQDISGKVDKVDGKGLSTNDLTNELKTNYDSAYNHSISSHAPSDAQKNSDITKAEIEAKLTGNITSHTHDQYLTEHQDISHLANKDDIPTKVSQLENDKGYLTEHQDLTDYAKKSELHSHSNKSVLDNITSDKVAEWDNKSTFSGNYNDLTNKPTIPTVPTNISAFTNDSGYLTSVPSEYVTDGELTAKGFATQSYVDDAINGVDVTEQLKEYAKLTDLNGLFDDVALNEQETTDTQTAIDFYSNGEVVKTVYFSGGSGTSATSAYISTELSENVLVSTGEDFNLILDFSSPNLGKGTLKVFINDVDAVTKSIGQGESTTPISGDLFSKGQNKVVVYVLDRVGVMSNSLTFYVRYGSLEITSDFDAYSSYDYGSVVRYYFTPIAVDTSLALTMYMSIDGQTQTGVSCTSDTRGYFTFPSNLSVGNHLCKAWVQDSNGSLSNELVFNLIILDDTALVVATDTHDTVSIEEGEQLSLDYKVYMKGNSTFNVYVYVDNNQVSTGTCGLTTSYYKTSSLSLGLHTVKVEVFDTTNTVSDYVTWTVNITESSYEMKTPVTAGATFIASAKNKSNQDENREIWIGTDQDGNNIEVPLSDFSWNEESGWVNDQLIISGNSYVEIPIKPLATNAKYGFTLDIEFLTRPIGVEDALVLDLWDEENNCGIKITTEELIMQSKAGNRCDLYFEEDAIVSAMFVIDRNEGTAKIYLDGVMCEAFHLSDYEVNGVDYLEDFTVDKNIKLGGSGYCAIRNIRTYQVALTTNEIINNFISNKIVKSEQRELVEFQKGTDLPTMTIYCDFSGLGKDDKKPCNISYVSTDVNKYGESFTLDGKYSQLQYQGTSSMAYPIKNYRINPRDKDGKKKINPFIGGKPESRFTLKADFITSNHAHNTGMAKFISDKLYNYNDEDESTMNPMRWHLLQNGGDVNTVRETINGFPIRLILINDGSTTLNEGQAEPTPGNTKDMGIFNFNNDKDNLNTMGMDTDVFPNCISFEVTANSDTSAGAFVPYDKAITVDYYEYTAGICCISIPFDPSIEHTLNCYDINGNEITANIRGDYQGSTNEWVGMINTQPYSHEYGCYKFSCSNQGVAYFRLYLTFNNTYDIERFVLDGVEYKKGNYLEVDNKEVCEIKTSEQLKQNELEYLQQSFELRYPDEDDVGSDYGYLGMAAETVMAIDYFTNSNGNDYTTLLKIGENDLFKYITVSYDNDISTFTFDVYNSNKVWMQTLGPFNCGDSVDPGNYSDFISADGYLAFAIPSGATKITIKGNEYVVKEKQSEHTIKNPYLYDGFSNYGLKRVIDWVGTCTDEEFKADFDKYFNRHYTLRYYLLVVLMAGVDNLGGRSCRV